MLKYIKLSMLSMAATLFVGNVQADGLELTSDAFANDGAIPAKYTCQGDNVSPQLSWSNPPSGARYYALIVDDSDAKDAGNNSFVHWVVANISVSEAGLAEGVDLSTLEGVVAGVNDFGNKNYDGPCPQDTAVHHYNFTLYAVDSKLDLANGVSRNDVLAALVGHELGSTTLVGTYSKQ